VGGICHLLLGLFLALFMPEEGFAPTPQEDRDSWQAFRATLQAGMQSIRARPLLMTILAISFFYGLYSEGLDRLWQPHFLENAAPPTWNGISSVTWFGIIQAAVMLVVVVIAEAARRRAEGLSPQRMAVLLAGLTAVISAGLVLFGMAGNFSVALGAYMTVAIVRQTLQPLYSAWTNRGIPPAVRATVLSTLGQMDAVGQVVGGPAIGVVANQFGLRPAIVLSGLVLSPALLLYRRAFKQAEETASAADEPAGA
jgi:MFS transporter, DHA3 family, tetracycline resistance protein